MGAFVAILIFAAIGGMVFWNHRTASHARAGVEFATPLSAADATEAIRAAHCGGAKAAIKSGLTGVKVAPNGASGFLVQSKYGDRGSISVVANGVGAKVRASTSELFVGNPVRMNPRSGLFALSYAMTSAIYRVLGITPGASRMKRFQANSLRRTLAKREAAAGLAPVASLSAAAGPGSAALPGVGQTAPRAAAPNPTSAD
jgi:hypothetical protein